MKQLFTEGRAAATALIWVVYFMNLLNLYFLTSWLPTIISDAGIPVRMAILLTTLFQVGGIGGALALGRVLDRYFSFRVLAACYLWAAVCVFSSGGRARRSRCSPSRLPAPGWASSAGRTRRTR